MTVRIIRTSDPLNDPAVRDVRDKLRAPDLGAGGERVDLRAVHEILEDVRKNGDIAVIERTENYDGVSLTPERLRVASDDIAAAHKAADPALLALMRRAIGNIRQYQERILVGRAPQAPPPLRRGGRELGVRYLPVDRVGVYVPGGLAVYPSTVLMMVVPAQVAGVREIAMVSPPTPSGSRNPMLLVLAGELGITELYCVGGAQAIAALALGTESIRAVDKIVGPGNAFVTEAKRQVFGRVGIDSLAGPSEVLIIADDTAKADWVAADMWAQTEHNPGSAVLVTPSEKLAKAVAAQVPPDSLERAGAIRAGLEAYGAIIVVGDIDAACEVANDFAPEHLQIMTADDEAVLAKVRHAGAIFVGPHTPVPLGDYYAGPSHVLPTGGTARFFSPLSANDFLKASSIIRYDAAALADDADDVIDFARREGLTAHARAVEIRRKPS